MRVKIICISVCVLLLTAQVVGAASPGDEAAVRGIVEPAMMEMAKDNINGATDILAPYWSFTRSQLDSGAARAAEQRKRFQSRYGNTLGFLLVEQTTVAGTFLRLVYVEKFERAAIRWSFHFYKPVDRWSLNGFAIDSDIGSLFLRVP